MSVALSQNEMLLYWLRLHPESGITSMEAFRLMGCTRLAARVAELRARGHDIETRMETRNGSSYARYVLVRS